MAQASTATRERSGRRSAAAKKRGGAAASGRKQRRAATKERSRLLPPEVAALARRRLLQLLGLGVVALALALVAALASYDARDPSWSATGTGAVRNWFGIPGSYAADALYQPFGLAAFLFPLTLLAWGGRLMAGQHVAALLWRLVLLPAALLLAALAAAGIEPDGAWPATTGPGGLIGGHLYNGARTLLEASEWGLGPWLIGAAAGALGLVFLLLVLGITRREWAAAFGTLWAAVSWVGLLPIPDRETRRERRAERRRAREASAVAEDDTASVAAVAQRAAERAEGARPKAAADRKAGRSPLPPKEERDATSRASLRDRFDAPPKQEPEGPKTAPAAKSAETQTPGQKRAATPPGERAGRTRLVENKAAPPAEGKRAATQRQPRLALDAGNFELPELALLQEPPRAATVHDEDALEQNARYLETVLQDFGIKGKIVKVRPGPVVTLYELEPAPGIKAVRVINLADDIARSMSAVAARVAVIPGRNVIGIELPNSSRETVYLRELLSADAYERTGAKLPLVLGKDIGGQPVIADLARMPHLLIAGTTGSGKSVGINTMILSLLYTLPPSRCRFIMVDPKMLELSIYDDIPHLLSPVVTDPKKAVVALRWTVREMENRYQAMSKLGVRNLDGYNQRLEQAKKKGETLTAPVTTGTDEQGRPIEEERPIPLEPLPHIVVIVDEMADLMMVAGKDIEAAVQRLAQMARAAGIHLIMATQRPSVDVITGTIKANFPTRISFQVTSKIDSRTILGEQGAEQLLGQGDMLYMAGGGRITRVHGPFVSDQEVEQVVAHLKSQGTPDYVEDVTAGDEDTSIVDMLGGGEADDLYRQAVQIVIQEGKASTSFIQRKLQIGYNRAARIMEQMEEEGIVSPANHAGKREILVDHA